MISLSTKFSRFIHAAAPAGNPSLLLAEYYSLVWMHHVPLSHSLVGGHLSSFRVMLSNTAMTIHVQIFAYAAILFLSVICLKAAR